MLEEFTSSVEAGDRTILRVKGAITAAADLDALLADLPSTEIAIDLGSIVHVNSEGVRKWIEFINSISARATVVLERCSPAMMQQFAMLKAAVGRARIRSILLPYHCRACGLGDARTLEIDGPTPDIPRHLPCPRCRGEMSFDDIPEIYLAPFAATHASVDPMIGLVLEGRFEIKACVGSGGMGVVYRAEQTRVMRRDVAVKVLHASFRFDDVAVQRFENEARIIAQLRHPTTLKMIDSGRTDDGRLYIVTEFLAGTPLDRLIRKGPLQPVQTLRILRQICDSLDEAHALGVVHRDLKPANVFMQPVGNQEIVRVLDFGIAKLINHPGLTAPVAILGTPAYMAPEQASGGSVDARSDFYALGATAYECLSGQPVFTGATPISVMLKHVTEEPVPVADLCPTVSREISRFVMRLLAKNPSERHQSAREVQDAIDRLIEGSGRAAEHDLDAAREATKNGTRSESATKRDLAGLHGGGVPFAEDVATETGDALGTSNHGVPPAVDLTPATLTGRTVHWRESGAFGDPERTSLDPAVHRPTSTEGASQSDSGPSVLELEGPRESPAIFETPTTPIDPRRVMHRAVHANDGIRANNGDRERSGPTDRVPAIAGARDHGPQGSSARPESEESTLKHERPPLAPSMNARRARRVAVWTVAAALLLGALIAILLRSCA